MFQRIGSEEYAELQNNHAIIDSLQMRVRNLEDINIKLEQMLENQAKQNVGLERDSDNMERLWKEKTEELQKNIEKLNTELQSEKLKNERLREHLSRTERELYGILQRKYELMRGSGRTAVADAGGAVKTGLSPTWESSNYKSSYDPSVEEMYSSQPV